LDGAATSIPFAALDAAAAICIGRGLIHWGEGAIVIEEFAVL